MRGEENSYSKTDPVEQGGKIGPRTTEKFGTRKDWGGNGEGGS